MDNTDPREFSRRILLAVTGLSPQIVTETLYGLSIGQVPPFVPTEVHLVTTAEGAERARLQLLRPKGGWFHRLRSDFDLPPITFSEAEIHVLRDAAGDPLADIRSPADNTRAADTMVEIVRGLTADESSALHVSIAGGRKTMGFYLGYALSLYGRAQDRLSHVLVNAPYESHPEFFYPSPSSRLIYTRPQNRPHDTREAEVTLADIPYVRLRDGLDSDLLAGRASFSSTVANAQRSIPQLALALFPSECSVEAGGERFTLPPAKFAFYWMLAERAMRGGPAMHESDPDFDAEYRRYYQRVVHPDSGWFERAEGLKQTGDNVNPTKSHIKREFEKHLGRRRARPYVIKSLERLSGKGRSRRFGLDLPPDVIRIQNLAGVADATDLGENESASRTK